MVYFLVIKRVHSFSHSCTDTCYKHYANWMNLKTLSVRSQAQRVTLLYNPIHRRCSGERNAQRQSTDYCQQLSRRDRVTV